MTRTIALAAVLAAATSGAALANPFVEHALESGERANARAIAESSGEVTTYSSSGSSVSALRFALEHAEETGEQHKAAYLRSLLNR